MKPHSIWFALCLTASMFAAPTKILIRGDSVQPETGRASGRASAIVGDLTIKADALTLDSSANVIRCEGETTIRSGGSVITGRDCVVSLAPGEKKIAWMGAGPVSVSFGSTAPRVPLAPTDLIGRGADRDRLIQEFYQRTEARSPFLQRADLWTIRPTER